MWSVFCIFIGQWSDFTFENGQYIRWVVGGFALCYFKLGNGW